MNCKKWRGVTFVVALVSLAANVELFSQTARAGPMRRIDVKGVGFELVRIPAGEFMMGSDTGETSEKPAHRVKVAAFELGRTEVTVRQFRVFVEATGYPTDAEKGEDRGVFTRRWSPNPSDRDWEFKKDGNWRNPGFVQSENDPVVALSWNDAVAFRQWLARETGEPFRLPTEAEWEYAARAAVEGAVDNFDDVAWHASNSDGKTHPVGRKNLTRGDCMTCRAMDGNGWPMFSIRTTRVRLPMEAPG